MKFKKNIMAAISIILSLTIHISVSASVLGELTGGYKVTMADNTKLHHYKYNTNTTAQSEYFVEYKPGSDVVPMVVNGDSIYGRRTITQAAEYMKSNGMKPMIGINGDYFSYMTGVPMGHTIIDGELVTSDPSGQNAVGFNSDGTGFISWLEIQSKFIKKDGSEMMLDCINKWCQPTISTSYLLTDKFAASTKTSGNCKFVIFSKLEGRLAIGDSITLRVDEIFDYDGDILIPEGKYVLVMTNTYGTPEKLQFMSQLQIGEEVELKSEAVYDKDKWSKVSSAIGSVGGRLIEEGKLNSNFEAGTAPRTAVGIKADGSIVFYVIDGRQSGYSTGVQIKTLAKRMAELGCIDAINLDGGGSTAIAGVFPGSDEMSVLNKPSDGGLRSCANFIFLQDKRSDAWQDYNIKFNASENRKYLSGYKENIDVSVTDTNGKAADKSVINYSLEQSADAISFDGKTVTLSGDGAGFLTVQAGNSQSHLMYRVYSSPHEIKALADGQAVEKLQFVKGEKYSVDIDGQSYVYSSLIHSYDSLYKFSCDRDLGYIDENGVFVPDTTWVKSGNIYIEAGNITLKLPVEIINNSAFEDMYNHWAVEDVNELFHRGIITGEDKDGKLVFRPDSNITRGEFAVMISRYMGLDIKDYDTFDFADKDLIPQWQKLHVDAVAANGIITGKKTDNGVIFAGEDLITRAEAMTIIHRSFKVVHRHPDVSFTDSARIPDYAKVAINALVDMGIVSGYEDGSVKPLGNVTRAESAKLINTAIKKMAV